MQFTIPASFLVEAETREQAAAIAHEALTIGVDDFGSIVAARVDTSDAGRVSAPFMTEAQAQFEPDRIRAAALRMEDQGGGFACAIANAYFRADRENRARLLAAFGHLFEEYAER